MPDGSPIPVNLAAICGQPIGSGGAALIQLQQAFQAATLAAGPAANAAFIGNTLGAGTDVDGINLFAPKLSHSLSFGPDEHWL